MFKNLLQSFLNFLITHKMFLGTCDQNAIQKLVKYLIESF